MGNTP